MSDRDNDKQYSFTTRLLNIDHDMGDGLSMSPPIHQEVNYAAIDAADFAEKSSVTQGDQFYARHGNPTSSRLARIIADLEGGETGIVFASGMGAITTTLLTFLKRGDHVVTQKNHYIGTTEVTANVLPQYGVEVTSVDQRSVAAFEAALQPNTKIILLESPVNPLMYITDLSAVAALARDRGILTFCDNTFATSINQRPMEHGVDIVMHSATKYIGGHHDLLAGSITASNEIVDKIWDMSMNTGAIPAPFNSWLALRGIRTLELRVNQQNINGLATARLLEDHSAVSTVHYPGLETHAQHELACQQMSGFGGLLSFELMGGYDAGIDFIEKLKLVRNAGSLGGVGSIVIQPAVMFGGRLSPELLEEQGITPGLIRLATGIENTGDLLADIEQALG